MENPGAFGLKGGSRHAAAAPVPYFKQERRPAESASMRPASIQTLKISIAPPVRPNIAPPNRDKSNTARPVDRHAASSRVFVPRWSPSRGRTSSPIQLGPRHTTPGSLRPCCAPRPAILQALDRAAVMGDGRSPIKITFADMGDSGAKDRPEKAWVTIGRR